MFIQDHPGVIIIIQNHPVIDEPLSLGFLEPHLIQVDLAQIIKNQQFSSIFHLHQVKLSRNPWVPQRKSSTNGVLEPTSLLGYARPCGAAQIHWFTVTLPSILRNFGAKPSFEQTHAILYPLKEITLNPRV